MTTPARQYRELAETVVTHFRGDINIDLMLIKDGTPAIFYLRSHGTHAVTLYPFNHYPPEGEKVPYLFSRADRHHILEQTMVLNRHLQDSTECKMVVYFDGTTIKEIDKLKADILVEDYVHDMRNKFKRWNGLADARPA